MSQFDLSTLKPGQEVLIDGRMYARCAGCKRVIRTDRPVLGSLHFCDPDLRETR